MSQQASSALSRRKFIALAGGSVASASVLAACGGSSNAATDNETAKFGKGDAGILNYLLTVELLQAKFYEELAESNRLTTGARETFGKFGEEEVAHISRLTKEVERQGGKPIAATKAKFDLKTDTETLEFASTLENVGAAAYLGQLPHIKSDVVLKSTLEIHSVEGRHAATVDDLLGEPLTPDGAFAQPVTVSEVLATPPFSATA